MKLKPVVVEFTSDNGQRIAGPWPLPLTPDQRRELQTLAREYGPLAKEQSSAKD
jgi:hypothetical protein